MLSLEFMVSPEFKNKESYGINIEKRYLEVFEVVTFICFEKDIFV